MKPQDTVLAIDLHGVLFTHDYKKMFGTFFQSNNKLKLILALINPSLWLDVIRLIHKDAVAEQFLVGLANKHHRLKPFVPLGIQIANQQKPNQPFIKLLKQLKQRGYKLYLFSNIGSIIFDDLLKKFPELFNLFESFTLPSKANGYIRKPTTQAFKRYLQTNNLTNKKIILIDDKRKNIEAAKKLDLQAIFFNSTVQIQLELETLGLVSING